MYTTIFQQFVTFVDSDSDSSAAPQPMSPLAGVFMHASDLSYWAKGNCAGS